MNSLFEQISTLSPEKRELFELMLIDEGIDLSEIVILPRQSKDKSVPVSFAQQRLWFLDQLEPGNSLYSIPAAVKIRGNFNKEAFKNSINTIIKRHSVLRTVFSQNDGSPSQIIAGKLKIDLPEIDLSGIDKKEIHSRVNEVILSETEKPFDLQTGPLIRALLLKLSVDETIVILTVHHIVSDGWSMGVIISEIKALYPAYCLNKPVSLPELPVQYADYAVWQRKWFRGKVLEQQITYWKNQLKDVPPLIELPTDRPRPASRTYRGDHIIFNIEMEKVQKLEDFCLKQDVTMFMTLISVFQALLHRYSGQSDICVGSPIANRNRAEVAGLIGFFVNTLVMRGDLSENPAFTSFLERMKHTILNAYANQDLPFEMLVEAVNPNRALNHSPLFQVMFVYNNTPENAVTLPGLEVSLIDIESRTSKFDIIMNLTETENILQGKLEYNTDIFNRDTMERFIEHFKVLIDGILINPLSKISDLPMLTGEEFRYLTTVLSKPEAWYDSEKFVHELFEAQAEKSPQAIALIADQNQLSYEELNTRANCLARYLIRKGVLPGTFVGVSVNRTPDLIIGILGILKAGGTYLPLDPGYPKERIRFMLEDSSAKFVLTQERIAKTFPTSQCELICLDSRWPDISKENSRNPEINLTKDLPAYIIYTSGSTGTPKGVLISHQAIANHCCDMKDYYKITPEDHILQFASFNFDASVEQILPTLTGGARLVLRDDEIWPTIEFHNKIRQFDLSVINLPTAYWQQLALDWASHPEWLSKNRLRLVIIGGDRMSSDTLELWQKTPLSGVRLLNAYGPTETTITASAYDIPQTFKGTNIPIGRPRANREFYILDNQLRPLPVGIPGELHIGGNALAIGYLNQPELTAEKFINNPFGKESGILLYKTGDLARYLPDGNIEFLGRADNQVKIRAFRIELGEIEAALNQCGGISRSIVTAIEDSSGVKRLIAYYINGKNQDLPVKELRGSIQKRLPDYMIPSAFIRMDQFPLSPAGKIDRRALPVPDNLRPELESAFVTPRTPTEKKIAGIAGQLLKIEKIGVYDNFFELGGHSMLATQFISRLRESFNVEIPLRSVFENPTVDGMMRVITESQSMGEDQKELDNMLAELESLSEEEVQKIINTGE
ncbi:MAG: amino acid adenylation domain-containing protein [Calditrichaceae bacterium]